MNNKRPLSPHLSIHRKLMTAVLSISHRLTGIALSLGTILIVLWISLIALGGKYFYIYQNISSSIFFKIILFLWTIGIFYHLFNGIRYLYWSIGWGMDIKTVSYSGYIVIFLTLISSILIWLI